MSHNNPPGHTSLITGFEGVRDYWKWEEENSWCRTKKDLFIKMTESEEYKECKRQFKKEQIRFNRKIWKKRSVKYLSLIAAWVALNYLLSLLAYSVDLGSLSQWSAAAIENLSIPLLLSVIIPNIILDFKEP